MSYYYTSVLETCNLFPIAENDLFFLFLFFLGGGGLFVSFVRNWHLSQKKPRRCSTLLLSFHWRLPMRGRASTRRRGWGRKAKEGQVYTDGRWRGEQIRAQENTPEIICPSPHKFSGNVEPGGRSRNIAFVLICRARKRERRHGEPRRSTCSRGSSQ